MSFLKKKNFLKLKYYKSNHEINPYEVIKIFCNIKDSKKYLYTIKEHDHNTRVVEGHTYKCLRKFEMASLLHSVKCKKKWFLWKKKSCFIIVMWPWENYLISLWKIKISKNGKRNVSGFTRSFRASPHFSKSRNLSHPSLILGVPLCCFNRCNVVEMALCALQG